MEETIPIWRPNVGEAVYVLDNGRRYTGVFIGTREDKYFADGKDRVQVDRMTFIRDWQDIKPFDPAKIDCEWWAI